MRIATASLLMLIAVAACTQKPNVLPTKPDAAAAALEDIYLVASGKCVGSKKTGRSSCRASIIDLIANPDPFEGRKVTTYGFVHLGFEDNGLYLHEEDLVNNLFTNGLWIDLAEGVDPSKCQDKYSLVEGTFKGGPSGHFGLWSGRLENVTRCESSGRKRR
jgi:hypothetical protein